MISKLLIVSIAMVSSIAHSQPMKDWNDIDKKLFIASEVVILADWNQTLQAARNPNRYAENNLILGRHPSIGYVNSYFAGALVANYFVADYFSNYRTQYLGTVIAAELIVVGKNRAIGLKIGF